MFGRVRVDVGGMSAPTSRRLILDKDRPAGFYARREAEKARRAWFYGTNEQRDKLWNEYRREMGACAEEAVGRFLDLLAGWSGAEVFHAVEFRGSGLPSGDVDHLILFAEHALAVAVESKYRLGADLGEQYVPRIREHSAAVSEVLRTYTWPVLCQAVEALRDSQHEEWIGRTWIAGGYVLACDALWLARSIMDIVADFDAFRSGGWSFPE